MRKFIILLANRLFKVSWIYGIIKFFVHLIPPLEKKIVSILYPRGVPVFQNIDDSEEDIIMTEHGKFIYEKIKFMAIKK